MRVVVKILLGILLGLMALFVIAVGMLYMPPVQNFLRKQAVELVAEYTGLKVAVDDVTLRFPLKLRVQGAWVADTTIIADTLLYVRNLDIGIQVRPLLHGQVEVDGITLEDVQVNSAHLLPGMCVEGRLRRFFLAAHGIDLKKENAYLDNVELDNARLKLTLTDTTETAQSDTVPLALKWRMNLAKLQLNDVEVDLRWPDNHTTLSARVKAFCIDEAYADLARQSYGWKKTQLELPWLNYDCGNCGTETVSEGLDVNHIALRSMHIGMDSVRWEGSNLQARLTNLALIERSGLEITTLTGNLYADTTGMRVPNLQLITPYSKINARAEARPGGAWTDFSEGHMKAYLDARIGKQDIMLLSKGLPDDFHRDYPSHALRISLRAEGNLANLELTRLETILPGAFELKGNGEMTNLTDSLNRQAYISLQMQTEKLDFLRTLLAEEKNNFMIPDSMSLMTEIGLRGNDLKARLELEEGDGRLAARARYQLATESYQAVLAVDSLGIHHFLPNDSLRELTLHAGVEGRGMDFASSNTRLQAKLKLNALRYGQQRLADISLKFRTDDSIGLQLMAGDLSFRFHAKGTLNNFVGRTQRLTTLLQRQIADRSLNHAALRGALPVARMSVQAGTENPLSDYLKQQQIKFEGLHLNFGLSPEEGINGRTDIQGLHADSLRLDTVFLAIQQDTARIYLQSGIINNRHNPWAVFRSTLTGEVRNKDVEFLLNYVDGQGNTGIHLGVNAHLLTEGHGRGNGLLLNLLPEQPILAYRRFSFADQANWLYLHRDGHVYAGINMRSDDGIGLRLLSDPADTVSLQNIQVALTRFRLDELSSMMPYLPRLAGMLSVEGHYIQTENTLQMSGKADVKELTYEGQMVGDVGLNASWVPRENGRHYLTSALTLNNQEVADINGMLDTGIEKVMPVDLHMAIKRLPLAVANAFVPDGMAKLAGKADGSLRLSGTLDKPLATGSLTLDSASVYVGMLGARYYLGNRPIRLEDGQLNLDSFPIYTTNSNPFIIDGNLSLFDAIGPVADLHLQADNYTLLDARRTRESLVYGKMVTNLNATVKGPVSALVIRGNMHLLGTTDLTYVLTDSPLTVDDRLSGLVTFVSFSDTTSVLRTEATAQPPGGIDMLMTVRIDDAVRLRADLSPDRSKYIELEGGGDLSLRYTPQGDMTLTGRYTLSDGVLKYSLPIIPLKEFRISRGSYVDWRGDMMNPTLELTATEQTRASVAEGDDGQTRMVDFDVSIGIRGRLSSPELLFDITAPHDATVQNELLAMGADERSKQAIAMLATGIYLNSGVKGGGLDMGAALNSVLQSQINSLAGQVKGASISVGVEDRTSTETGVGQTDYSFRYAQRFFGDRVQIVIGGKVSTGAGATNSVESFIDNISLEYRLDASGTRYIRAFYNKNYESVLDGEITETGIGLVLRRKVDRLGELFIFRKKKEEE